MKNTCVDFLWLLTPVLWVHVGPPLLSLRMSQVAHQATAYPSFCSMKLQGIFLLSLDGLLVHGWVTPNFKLPVPIYSCGWRVKCLAQEHNTMSPARA